MPKKTDFTGQQIGIWKVIAQTNKRTESGCIIYKCLNCKNKKEYEKSSSYLADVIRYKCKSDKRGRPRKWIIIKKPYIEEKEA